MKKSSLLGFIALMITFLGGLDLARADTIHLDLPYGIGSFQLPWQSTEVVYGVVRTFRGNTVQQIAGVSLPILTLGKLANGYRLFDGQLGAVGAWPSQSNPVDFYGGIGHDVVQDIPALSQFKSFHINGCVSFSNAMRGWTYGGTASYAFGGSSN